MKDNSYRIIKFKQYNNQGAAPNPGILSLNSPKDKTKKAAYVPPFPFAAFFRIRRSAQVASQHMPYPLLRQEPFKI